MNKSTIFVGIDISKDTFDIYDSKSGHLQFKNDAKGFSLFGKQLSTEHWCVMEATGSYHQRLAIYLYEQGIQVTVMNPLVIKRFIQMKLINLKTDKSDAKMICHYGEEQSLELWTPQATYIVESKKAHNAIRLYFKQRTALKNMLHSLESMGQLKGKLTRSISRQIKQLDKEITQLEQVIEELIKTHEQGLYTRLKTIPGIGKKQQWF